jgi:hypothetical protein
MPSQTTLGFRGLGNALYILLANGAEKLESQMNPLRAYPFHIRLRPAELLLEFIHPRFQGLGDFNGDERSNVIHKNSYPLSAFNFQQPLQGRSGICLG